MMIHSLAIPDIKLITPDSFQDFRGSTSVLFDAETASELNFKIAQVNQGYSISSYTLRGLHYQASPYAQAKLISCLHGTIFNVAVDLQKTSPTFGKYAAELLSASNGKLMYIPKGFAHGYLTLEPDTLMQWCTDADFFGPAARCLKWNDPDVSIQWPLGNHCPILSEKDENGSYLRDLSKL